MANTLDKFRVGAVGFIDWLDPCVANTLALAYIAVIPRIGIDCPVCNLPGRMSKTNRPPVSLVIPDNLVHASLAVENAFAAEKRDDGFARSMWRVGWERCCKCNNRGCNESESFHGRREDLTRHKISDRAN